MVAKKNETKKEKFARVLSDRTGRITDTIRNVGNLTNKYHYEIITSEFEKAMTRIESEVKLLREKFDKAIKERQ